MFLSFQNKNPQIHSSTWIAPNAVVIGDVEIGEGSSIWFGTIIRGDVNSIRIGRRTNIQDLSVVHVSNASGPRSSPTVIGDDVTVGHRVILHGCQVGNGSLIGMGSIVMDGVEVGEGSMVAAGSLVVENTKIPPGHLALGSPAKIARPLKEREVLLLKFLSEHYVLLAEEHMKS